MTIAIASNNTDWLLFTVGKSEGRHRNLTFPEAYC